MIIGNHSEGQTMPEPDNQEEKQGTTPAQPSTSPSTDLPSEDDTSASVSPLAEEAGGSDEERAGTSSSHDLDQMPARAEGSAEPAGSHALSDDLRWAFSVGDPALEADIPFSPPPPEKQERRGCRIPAFFLALLEIGLIALLVVGGFLVWSSFTTMKTPFWGELAELLESGTLIQQFVPPTETATPVPTATGGGLIEPTPLPSPTQTPAVGVTLLPTVPPDDQPTPTQSTPVPTAEPTSTPTTPTPTQSASPDDGRIVQAGVQMVYVAGGTFMMGSDASVTQSPIHSVTLSPYYIDQFEVTNARWAACVAAGGCSSPTSTRTYDGSRYYGVATYKDYPVIFVDWHSASAYCQWRGARLPTEAEWEMAARWNPDTNTVTTYPWGDEWDPARLNYCDASCLLGIVADLSYDDHWPQMAPVGSFPSGASAVGAMDMIGNVAEWVADWFSPTYYSISPAENPTGPHSGTLRVARGGAWGVSDAHLLTGASRSRFAPGSESAGLGLRCAISADQVDP